MIRTKKISSLTLLGFFLLLIGSYLDNVRGPLMPHFGRVFGASYQDQSTLLVIGNLGGLICTFLLMPILNRFSLTRTSMGALLFMTLICLATPLAQSFSRLLLVGLGFGICISLFGTLSNLLIQKSVAAEIRGKALSLLNVMYGAGSFAAPLIATQLLQYQDVSWNRLYLALLPVAGIVVLSLSASLKKIPHDLSVETKQPIGINIPQMFIVVTMCLYVCGEVLTSMWMVSYLERVHRYASVDAGRSLSFFFLLMVLTRLGCAFLVPKEWNFRAVVISLLLASTAFATGYFADLPWLIGCSGILGPVFPLYVAHVSSLYPKKWRSMTIWMLSMVQASLAMAHLFLGEIADRVGISQAFKLPLFFLLGALALMILVDRRTRPREG